MFDTYRFRRVSFFSTLSCTTENDLHTQSPEKRFRHVIGVRKHYVSKTAMVLDVPKETEMTTEPDGNGQHQA